METDPRVIAFVQGAQWWEYKQSGATMWQSDQNDASDEAERRLASGTLGVSVREQMESAPAETGCLKHLCPRRAMRPIYLMGPPEPRATVEE